MCRRMLLLPVIGALLAGAITVVSGCGSSGSKASSSAGPAGNVSVGGKSVTGPVVGVTFDGPALSPKVDITQQIDRAVASGVESVRVEVNWSQLQPLPSISQVPAPYRSQFQLVGGVPTTFGNLDRVMSAAAARHLSVLPVVEYTPSWAATDRKSAASPPKDPATYATFMAGLAKRYGPDGSFWTAHPSLPKLPIRMWQIWNEPHFTSYWTKQPFAPSYVALLKAAHDAVKSVDPGAKIVLAGLADFSWRYLAQVYRQPNAAGLFDIVAIHPYTAKPRGVITILKRARQVMNQNGDSGKPILATEVTWPSSEGKAPPQFGVGVTEAQQTRLVTQAMQLLMDNAQKLNLTGFYWYTWLGDETPIAHPYGFDFAGLEKDVDGTVAIKPALAAFKTQALRIEGCRAKADAVTCSS